MSKKIEEAASQHYPYKENYSSRSDEAIHKTQQDLKRQCFIEGALSQKEQFKELNKAETILNDIHQMLSLLPHLPMEKYNPISGKLIEAKNIIRNI